MTGERSATSFDKILGERVRAQRLAAGMSQEELAEILGITFQQVQKYEKGVNRIAASRLYDIAQALDLPVCDFFEGLGGGKKSMAESEYAELSRLFQRIANKKARRQVLNMVRAMGDE